MSSRFLVPLAGLILIILVSGCVNIGPFASNRPEDAVKNIPQVQEYITNHPDFDLMVTQRSEGYIRGRIDQLSDRCGPYFKISDYWEVVLKDSQTRTNLTAWLEKGTNQLGCLYGEGVDSPPAYIPGPPKTELLITGFSNLDVNGVTTEFYDSKLHLSIGNPNIDRITIKRLTVSYLDDVMKDTTNSGLLSQGDSVEYEFDFSKTINEDDSFWIEVEVLYDINDRSLTNQKSRGSIISGLDTSRIIQCSGASFEVERYNFFIGTRIFSLNLINTGNIDLQINTYYRQQDAMLEEAEEPFTLWYGGRKTLELEGLTKLHESVIFVSEACPGAQQVIFVEDIAGV